MEKMRMQKTAATMKGELAVLEHQLEIYERNKRASEASDQRDQELLGLVSHGLRTPLTSVREGIAQIRDGLAGPVSAPQKDFLATALRELDRLKRIVGNYLDLSKIESGRADVRRQVVNLTRLITNVLHVFERQASHKNLKLTTSFSQPTIEAFVDSDRMVQVVTNLVGNAVKFTERGEINVSLKDMDHTIEGCVSDTGAGISDRDVPRMFMPYEQASQSVRPRVQGTGLGLAITKQFIEMHKGRVWVESGLGKGSRFYFSLPKYKGAELLQASLEGGIAKAMEEETALSLLLFDVTNYDELRQTMDSEEVAEVVSKFKDSVKASFRRRSDQADVWDFRSVLAVLPQTSKEDAARIAERVQELIESVKKKTEIPIQVDCRIATFPDDGSTDKDLLKKALP